jgi:hypothetical protein
MKHRFLNGGVLDRINKIGHEGFVDKPEADTGGVLGGYSKRNHNKRDNAPGNPVKDNPSPS